jgi:DNA-binding SARP family transcriptional activator/tetratricopeptide (TPR) repeat protein
VGDLTFGVLGPVRVLRGGQRVRIGSGTTPAVLAALLLSLGRPVSGEVLVDLVWDADMPDNPRAALHNVIWRLRRLLGSEVVESSSDGYEIRAGAGLLDLAEFDGLVAAADDQLGHGDQAKGLVLLEEAVRLWRGPALENIGAGRLRRDMAPKLTERFLSAQERKAQLALDLGQHSELVADLADLVRSFPFREGLAGSLMLALYRGDRPADALAVYADLRGRLAKELGADPGPELQDLHLRMLRRDPGLRVGDQRHVPAARLSDPAPSAPHRGPGVVGPDGSLTIPGVPQQLPADIGDFTGRERELDVVHHALSSPEGRATGPAVVVIAGPGGAGKSALAVRAAHRLQPQYSDGQLYVDLQGAGSRPLGPAGVLSRFLRAFGIVGVAVPGDLPERAALFRSVVASRRVLILLDNAAAAAQVRQLLPGSPLCGVIVTARRRIGGLPGSQIVQLGMLEDGEAARLLAHLAGESRVRSEPAQAQALAVLCGGLPLALRIAGARLAARPHWQLADLTRRLGARHRRLSELTYGDLSVRASLALSYQGLPATAAVLLRRISLLDVPDFPAWAAAALLDTSLEQAADLLDSLVEAQLLEVATTTATGQRRYRCHDLTREFSRETSLADDSPAARAAALHRVIGALLGLAEHAHCQIYGGNFGLVHGQAQRWSPGVDPASLLGPDPGAWLEDERRLIVAAIRDAATAGLDELCWDLTWTAVTLFEAGSYIEDWGTAVDQALAACRRARNKRGEAAMVVAMASWLCMRESYAGALDMSLTGARLFAQLGDRHGQALAHRVAGLSEFRSGRLDSPLARFTLAQTMAHDAGDRFAEVAVLRDMADVHIELGDVTAALKCLADALSMSREIGSARAQAIVLHKLGQAHLSEGELSAAEQRFASALKSVITTNDRIGEAYVRLGLAEVQLARQADARSLLGEVLHSATQMGHQFLRAQVLLRIGQAEQSQGNHAAAIRSLRASIQITSRSGTTLWQARALDALAASYLATGAQDKARQATHTANQLRHDQPRRRQSGPHPGPRRSAAEIREQSR